MTGVDVVAGGVDLDRAAREVEELATIRRWVVQKQ
jgi:hypothetical protein